ncbi:GIY-YIG nuclease family protein [Devosia lacusdianchii]|uniref:GIY-YIG nuclease family protein n=1 Tax=Devosia lacusdianchii TaxID=2917991 RepID=UPI001F0669F5|nr:GIY-YIG nuclease family protein [Devosia sp. JXJ CY 41]
MECSYYVYILANRKRGTLYVGVTNDLVRRTHEHREGVAAGFTKRHGCKHLVWFETHTDIEAAILREKRVKTWLRPWKEELVEASNPDWRDLWWDIIGPQPPDLGMGPGSRPG